MANIFNVLNLEEPSMIEVPSSKSQPVKPKKKGPHKQIKTPTGMTLAEVESSSDDIQFGAMLFIEGFNDVRERLEDVWTSYREGKVDITTAAVTTDTAFIMLRHSYNEFASTSQQIIDACGVPLVVGDTPATGDRVDLTEPGTFDAFFAILTQGFDHGIG